MIMHVYMNDILKEYTLSITIRFSLNQDVLVNMKWEDK